MNAWGEGKHAILVKEKLRSCRENLTVALGEETAEHRVQMYHSLVLRRKAPDGGAVDYGERYRRSIATRGQVYEYGGPSDGGAPH